MFLLFFSRRVFFHQLFEAIDIVQAQKLEKSSATIIVLAYLPLNLNSYKKREKITPVEDSLQSTFANRQLAVDKMLLRRSSHTPTRQRECQAENLCH